MPTLTAIHEWVLEASLRASLLTLVVLVIQAVLRRSINARMRYALWLPVLVVLILPMLPQSGWSIESALQSKTLEGPIMPVAMAPHIETKSVIPKVQPPAPAPINWQRLVIQAWGTGAAGLLLAGSLSFLVTLHRYRKCRQPAGDELMTTLEEIAAEVGLRQVPRVCVSAGVRSPAVTGLLRPMLLLPADFDRDFTPAEARLVLTHELMHLRRGDLPLNAVMCLLMALHWFNPLLWFAFFCVRADRESACDAQVLDDASNDRRLEYGHALLKVETAFCPRGLSLGFVGIFQRGSALRARIHSIAANPKPHAVMKALITCCILATTFLGITRAETKAEPKGTQNLFAIDVKMVAFDKATDWTVDKDLFNEVIAGDASWAQRIMSETDTAAVLAEVGKEPAVRITSWPRMVTAGAKEVIIRSVVNHPAKGKDGKIEYRPVGLVLKLTATKLSEKARVALKVDLNDSKIVKPDPLIVSSYAFNNVVEMDLGCSYHILSWEDGKAGSKRPVLYVIKPVVLEPRGRDEEAKAEDESEFNAPKALVELLRSEREQQYDFAKANLGDVVRFLATDARLSIISLPDDHPVGLKTITFSIHGSPFSVLEQICRAHGLVLIYEGNIWYVRTVNDPELIGKSYPWLKRTVKAETICADIESILDLKRLLAQNHDDKGKAAPSSEVLEPGVGFREEEGVFYVVATRLQHAWVSAYFKGMGR